MSLSEEVATDESLSFSIIDSNRPGVGDNAQTNKSTSSSSKRLIKRKVPAIRRSLAIVLASYQGKGVVLELKDDSEVYGIVEEVDRAMSVSLIDAKHVFPNGNTIVKDVIHVNGSAIRYVHLPNVNSKAQVDSYLQTLDRLGRSSKPQQYKETESKRRRIQSETS